MPPGPSDPDDWVIHKQVLVCGPGLNSRFSPDALRGVGKKGLALPSVALVARPELPSVAPVDTEMR